LKKYGGMQVAEAKHLKALEEENRQLKRPVADQVMNLQVVKDLLDANQILFVTGDGQYWGQA
jgi:putative transposase